MNLRIGFLPGIFVLLLLAACTLLDDGSYRKTTLRYRENLSMHDSILVVSFDYPDSLNIPDTTYDTIPVLHSHASDSLLFEYAYESRAPRNVADGDYSESIFFVVPPGVNSFSIDSAHPGKVFFQNRCFGACGTQTVVGAEIEGHARGGGKYLVTGTVVYAITVWPEYEGPNGPYLDTVHFAGTFTRTSDAPDF